MNMTYKKWIILSYLLIFTYNVIVAVNNELETVSHHMGLMTRDIADRYFTHEENRCIVAITESDDDLALYLPDSFPKFIINVASNKIESITQPELTRKNVAERILNSLDHKCLTYIVNVASPGQIIQLLTKTARKSIQRENRKVLVLPLIQANRQPSNNNDILEMAEMAFLPDLLIANLIPANHTLFEIVTHSFTGATSWKDKVVVDFWTEADGFVYKSHLYPDKVANGMGKTLVFATFNYPPYAIVDATASSTIYDGTEMRLGKEFARIHNYSWSVLVDSKNEWGETWENESGNGILGNVLMDNAHLGFGALYLWYNEYQRLDFSFPYIRTGITCLAPKPKPVPGWKSPVLPFSKVMWVAVGASLLLTTVALYVVTRLSQKYLGEISRFEMLEDRFTTIADSAFRSLGLLVLQAPTNLDDPSIVKSPSRHLLSWLLVVFLLVTTCYSGGLASILTVPKFQRPIDTVADLAESNIPWTATHEAWVFSIKEATEPLIRHVYKQFKILSAEKLTALAPQGKMAFSVERLPAGHYAVGSYLTEEAIQTLRIMKQDIYWEQCVTVTRKGSPYTPALNKLIHRLLDSGLLLQWEGQVARRFLSERVQTEVRQSAGVEPHGPTKLKLEHVQGLFILLVFGLSLSAVVFAVELIAYKYSTMRVKSVAPVQTITSTGKLYDNRRIPEFNPYLK